MTNFAVFLRGINVGGVNIKMADLRTALADLPFEGVKTLLASGNVVCSAELSVQEVKRLAESRLRERFGYDAWVVVFTGARLAELIDICPYPADDGAVHTYVTLGSEPAVLDELASTAAQDPALQDASVGLTRLGPEAVAWLAPVGGTLESPFSKLSSKPKYKASTTTRNLRTLLKVRDAAAAGAART
ncbi:DUF1697 domain-containing protein [Paenarthrobacter sp. DKR-5]|uniref:DUF1697 domain-containing protein n=1 Tax=Paenarthrobacter sp. DKR-5 TaxID=2835535 RepID=UPI001BDD78B2|nr:DUF1697 domain-containing protein [Paenarthrobacter sp. DKR-5]MBT1003213.1 DUF1697 domain-containing protein [Paenarthrobacter sp. DKR-5]